MTAEPPGVTEAEMRDARDVLARASKKYGIDLDAFFAAATPRITPRQLVGIAGDIEAYLRRPWWRRLLLLPPVKNSRRSV